MASALYWEDVQEGMELPSLVKRPDTQQLVKWAGASGDYYQIHYDTAFAQSTGLSGVIVHGALKNTFLGQLITDWIGEHGTLKRLSCQYRGMDIPDTTLTSKGKVVRKYREANQHLVDCEIWLENDRGETTTPGAATVALPSRSQPSP